MRYFAWLNMYLCISNHRFHNNNSQGATPTAFLKGYCLFTTKI